jgi:hypothetical protein
MNWFRCSTRTPGASDSPTNAVIPPRWPWLLGTAAMTTSRSATVPFLVQSLQPLRTYADPSSTGTAVVASRADSLPTSGSVSRNAETSEEANRGR